MSLVTWHVELDQHACIGSGICVGLAPGLFALKRENTHVRTPQIAPDERVLDAADSCPALAIIVTDGVKVIGPRTGEDL